MGGFTLSGDSLFLALLKVSISFYFFNSNDCGLFNLYRFEKNSTNNFHNLCGNFTSNYFLLHC